MIGWRLLRDLAQQQQSSVVLEAARLEEPDYAVAAAAGGVALSRALGERVNYALDGPVPEGAFGWPEGIGAFVQAPALETLPRDRGVVRIMDEDELAAFIDVILRRHRDLGFRAMFATRFIDFAATNAISHSDDQVAFVAVRRDRGLWIAVGDAGPGIAARANFPTGPERSALAYWTSRLDTSGERGQGKLAALWRASTALNAEATFASGDELRQLTRAGTSDTFFDGSGATLLSVRT